ncbi:MAG TPA: hypothetical protein VKA27_15275 [Sunxiuqinia sp.]|nr:hypothetical protein [Sunxiuqinia sp.]
MNFKRITFYTAVGGVVLLLGIGAIDLLGPKPTLDQAKAARESMALAAKPGAETFAHTIYQSMLDNYDSAMSEWGRQNAHFDFGRNYQKVGQLLDRVIADASQAQQITFEQKSQTRNYLQLKLSGLERQIDIFERVCKRLPLEPAVITDFNKGKLKLSEAKIAFNDNRYTEALAHYSMAEELIGRSTRQAKKQLNDWFSAYPKWKKQSEEAIRHSAQGREVILIDKYAHSIFLYRKGFPLYQFEVDLGMNWIGDKSRGGGSNNTRRSVPGDEEKRGEEHALFSCVSD